MLDKEQIQNWSDGPVERAIKTISQHLHVAISANDMQTAHALQLVIQDLQEERKDG